METIKILHLFPQLLSLYGEYGNLAVLQKILAENGHTAEITPCEDGCADFSTYSMIYIGSGTEDNLMVALNRLMPHADAIRASVEDGTLWLATGNALTLFGRTVFYKDMEYSSVGAADYDTVINDTGRFLGDVLTADAYGAPLIGFINTSSAYKGIRTPLLRLLLGASLGNDKSSPDDGLLYKNFYGTQLIGPVLAKNPHFLAHLGQILTGSPVNIDPESNIARAYAVSLAELQKRTANT